MKSISESSLEMVPHASVTSEKDEKTDGSGVDSEAAEKTLAYYNFEIVETVGYINSLLDLDYELRGAQKELQRCKDILQRYQAQYKKYKEQLAALGESYEAQLRKLTENERQRDNFLKKLFKEFNKVAKPKDSLEAEEKLQGWTIPNPLKVPRPTEPKLPAQQSASSKWFARRVFQVCHYYHARSHLSVGGAKSHLEYLQKLLLDEISKSEEAKTTLSDLTQELGGVWTEIENLKYSLIENPPDYIWKDPFQAYQTAVANWLLEFARSNKADVVESSSNISQEPSASNSCDNNHCSQCSPSHQPDNEPNTESRNSVKVNREKATKRSSLVSAALAKHGEIARASEQLPVSSKGISATQSIAYTSSVNASEMPEVCSGCASLRPQRSALHAVCGAQKRVDDHPSTPATQLHESTEATRNKRIGRYEAAAHPKSMSVNGRGDDGPTKVKPKAKNFSNIQASINSSIALRTIQDSMAAESRPPWTSEATKPWHN